MNIRFDTEVDALYLQLSGGEVVDSETIEPNIVFDYDAEDQIVGIELLRVRPNLPDLAIKRLPFQSFDQQLEFLNFLETIADSDLQAKLIFAKKLLQNQRTLLQPT